MTCLEEGSRDVGGALNSNNKFSDEFHSSIRNCDTEQEFESRWVDVTKSYGLEENEWLLHRYNPRQVYTSILQRHFFNRYAIDITVRKYDSAFLGRFSTSLF